ncbi:serine/threonine-protein phosphatase PP2A 65 kDa regulatory subunit-like [Euwallacea fornicatus]|uniref:serine/threonine-protein phosphatase PP2A 65 kDa regulatory subunit-like n=1 Tax=Euwallacea fornicatus TaxID=995702 RepID=UPI00338F2B32
MSGSIDDLYDLEIFENAFSEENLELHIITIQNLDLLAKKLGPSTTREELLELIKKHYVNLHDEALLHLADQLKKFIPLVGGLEHSEIIFQLLGKLCVTDETIVREKAVETMVCILETLNLAQVEHFLLPVMNDLIKNDWFTSKCSAVELFPYLYPKLGEERRSDLRNSFKTLIQDDSPIVRKEAANACVGFVGIVEEEFLVSEFVPIFQDIAQDPMDSVRAGTTDIALALFKRVKKNSLQESVFKTLEDISDDISWRIRQRLANNIALIQQQVPNGKYRGNILALMQKLAQDSEPEVRVLIASNLFGYCENLKKSYATHGEDNFEAVFEQSIMAAIQKLALDESENVRLALCSNILPLSSLLGEECFKKNIVSFLLEALINEESIVIQAKYLFGLSSLSDKVDLTDSLDAIKNSIRTVIVRSHTNWRARRSVVATFVDVAKFCSSDYFSTNFKAYYATLLGDSIFAIRRTAATILPVISKHYGIKWSSEHLIPFFTTFTRDTRYLYRFVALFGISEMVRPYLCPEPGAFLGDWRRFFERDGEEPDKNVLLAFAKIIKTSHLIQKELTEEKYVSMLSLKDELSYVSHLDADIYLEQDFAYMSLKYKNLNLYSVEDEEFKDTNWPYLQGILNLIYNKFLPILDTLNKDPTENVQIGAICTLAEISEFITKLNQEESEEWVQKALKLLTNEEISMVIEKIHHGLKTAVFQETDLAEPLDTELMEAENNPDLTKTIFVESSTSADLSDKTKDESLIKEVKDFLNEKLTESADKNLDQEKVVEEGGNKGQTELLSEMRQ